MSLLAKFARRMDVWVLLKNFIFLRVFFSP
jgi:hypothetical protein